MNENVKSAAKVLDKKLNLPFDQHQRYRIVADVIERLRGNSGPLQILDVGGGEGIILNFLSEDRVTILEQSDVEGVPDFVKGDATALPFEDEAFDFVVSVDVYEHIRAEVRDRYLSELRRTARRGVLLAAPFDSDAVRAAELLANEFHRAMHLEDNVWLREHAENGLPSLEDAKRFFEGHDDTVSVLPNGYIPHWLAMICLTFYSSKLEGELSGISEQVNAFYNEFMYELDNTEPCYRFLLVSLKEPADAHLDELASSTPSPERVSRSSTLFGTLSAVLPLATEAKQFNARLAQSDRKLTQLTQKYERQLAQKERQLTQKYERQLAQKEGELARREIQVDDLSRRLAERVGVENARQVQLGNLEQMSANLRKHIANLERQRTDLVRKNGQLQQQFDEMTSTRGWRLLTALHRAKLRIWRLFGS